MSRSSASSSTEPGTSQVLPTPAEDAAALAGLLAAGAVDPQVITRLASYGAMALEANRRVNLTGARSPEAIAEHIRDSLTVLPYVEEPYVDVGSGAGFPAIPVAIVTAMPIALIEATAKKARVLSEFLEALELQGTVFAERAEAAGHRPDLREHFATGTCRAVGSAPAALELLLPLIAVGGRAVLQRGRMEPREEAALQDAALVLGGEVVETQAVRNESRIVVVLKRTTTPQRFPRRAGLAQKRPLCE